MEMDVIRKLGAFTLASRLKRLSDRLKAEATTLYHHQGVDFNDSWFLVGFLLSRQDNMNVTEMAQTLGISNSAVSQIVCEMERHNLLTIETDEHDKRCRLLSLSEDGREVVDRLLPVWEAVGDCTEELIESTGQDLLKAIADMEKELENRSLFARVINRISGEEREQHSSV